MDIMRSNCCDAFVIEWAHRKKGKPIERWWECAQCEARVPYSPCEGCGGNVCLCKESKSYDKKESLQKVQADLPEAPNTSKYERE